MKITYLGSRNIAGANILATLNLIDLKANRKQYELLVLVKFEESNPKINCQDCSKSGSHSFKVYHFVFLFFIISFSLLFHFWFVCKNILNIFRLAPLSVHLTNECFIFLAFSFSLLATQHISMNNEKTKLPHKQSNAPTKPSPSPFLDCIYVALLWCRCVCALNACCQMSIKHSYHHGNNPHTNMYTSSHTSHTCPCCLSPTTTTTLPANLQKTTTPTTTTTTAHSHPPDGHENDGIFLLWKLCK